MEWLSDSIVNLSIFSRHYLSLIALMLTAVLVMCTGKYLLIWRAGWLERLPVLARLPTKAMLNMAALGFVFLYVPDWLAGMLGLFNNMALAPVLVVILFLTGAVVDRCR
ncbi:MAG: DUF3392 family protein [Endozoicomonas sp. (ex Botrylloides leachii)]|nr:DUF3392 family protein [Endozoicomonas sp. (ex Botrylloides leachii)]